MNDEDLLENEEVLLGIYPSYTKSVFCMTEITNRPETPCLTIFLSVILKRALFETFQYSKTSKLQLPKLCQTLCGKYTSFQTCTTPGPRGGYRRKCPEGSSWISLTIYEIPGNFLRNFMLLIKRSKIILELYAI